MRVNLLDEVRKEMFDAYYWLKREPDNPQHLQDFKDSYKILQKLKKMR